MADANASRPLPFTLKDGAEIKVTALCNSECYRFAVSIGEGVDWRSLTHLLVNPRFDQVAVVRNSRTKRGWGTEERLGDFPFTKGENFELQIITRPTHYQILVNGVQCYKFGHRIPKETVKNVFFNGDLTVENVEFIEKTSVEADEPLEKPLFPLPFKLSPGKEIVVKGSTFWNTNRFEISLTKGTSLTADDTPFLFNPRFDWNCVVRNDFSVGKGWGGPAEEEREGGFPFNKDSNYEVKIIVTESHYEVYVDEKHFCNFNHRLPMESVRYVLIAGDTVLQEVETGDVNAVVNPSVPASSEVKGGVLTPGSKAFIYGKATEDAKRFNVNLFVEDGSSDIGLHFDVRFDYSGCKDTLVLNHKSDGKFGKEERHTEPFPFAPDQRFELAIVLEEDRYVIQESGKTIVTFEHRTKPPAPVTSLHIKDDAIIEKIFYE